MWFYYGLIIYVLMLSIIPFTYPKSKRAKLFYVILSLGLPAFLAMFRSEAVGNDTVVYVRLFYNVASSADFLVKNAGRYEVGYLILNKLLSYISNHHQILLIVTSGYMYFMFGRFIYKYSKWPWLSVFLFITMKYFDMSMSEIRQMLAVATLLLSYDYIVKREPLKFYFTVLLASLFHNAALVFLPAYILSNFKMSKGFIALVMMITGIIYFGFEQILRIILSVFPRYTYYLGGSYLDGQAHLGTVVFLLIHLAILIVAELSHLKFSVNESSEGEKVYSVVSTKTFEDEVQSIFIMVSCAILAIALKGNILFRLADVYTVFALVYLPNALQKIMNKEIKGLLLSAVIILFTLYLTVILIYRPEWQSSYPYSFFWNS